MRLLVIVYQLYFNFVAEKLLSQTILIRHRHIGYIMNKYVLWALHFAVITGTGMAGLRINSKIINNGKSTQI